jgi:hypothetical protein
VGRARLCRGAPVGGDGVGGGVSGLFACELIEAAAVSEGEGSRGVNGISGVDGDGGSMASGAWSEGRVRIGDCGGTCIGELCTVLMV